jgi:hypothetical protein
MRVDAEDADREAHFAKHEIGPRAAIGELPRSGKRRLLRIEIMPGQIRADARFGVR